jgi:hypothetical protein
MGSMQRGNHFRGESSTIVVGPTFSAQARQLTSQAWKKATKPLSGVLFCCSSLPFLLIAEPRYLDDPGLLLMLVRKGLLRDLQSVLLHQGYIRQQISCRPIGHDLAAIHHNRPITQFPDQPHIVAGDQHCLWELA